MQLALASRDDIPDFAPEPITADDIIDWSSQFHDRAERVLDELARRRSDLREEDGRAVDELFAQRRSLPSRVRELLPNRIGGMKIRDHGDFHLGQMLIVKDDVFIIDFEGEPRRSLAERRRKAPAARDLAGLIRSIDYSATAALDRALRSAPDEHGKIAKALDDWRERAVDTVLSAYHERQSDPRLWPQDRDKADGLLDFFLLEKVFYEIEYELSYRPDWVRVPVRGALRILTRQEALAA
jgi:maltose alpha-D-glucosyltransferase/alpha-amylase